MVDVCGVFESGDMVVELGEKNGIHETTEYLELFLKNLLLGEKNELHNRAIHISGQFNCVEKVDIETTLPANVSRKTLKKYSDN